MYPQRRRTLYRKYDSPKVEHQPKTLSTNNESDRNNNLNEVGKIKIRKNKSLHPMKSEELHNDEKPKSIDLSTK